MAAHVFEDATTRGVRWPHGLVLMVLCWLSLAHAAQAAPTTSDAEKSAAHDDDESILLGLSYTIGFPSADLHAIIDDPSFRGFDVNIHAAVLRSWYIGVAVGYNHFHEDDGRDTYETDWGAVTGTFYRAYGSVSLALSNRYYLLSPQDIVRPYAGLRLGVSFGSASLMVADVHRYSAPAGFLVAPEAGVAVRLLHWLRLSVAYQYDFTTNSFREVDQASFHAVQLGALVSYY
jgi:hypothetical protein